MLYLIFIFSSYVSNKRWYVLPLLLSCLCSCWGRKKWLSLVWGGRNATIRPWGRCMEFDASEMRGRKGLRANCFRCKEMEGAKRKKGEQWKPEGRCYAELYPLREKWCCRIEGSTEAFLQDSRESRDRQSRAATFEKSRRGETKFRWIARVTPTIWMKRNWKKENGVKEKKRKRRKRERERGVRNDGESFIELEGRGES